MPLSEKARIEVYLPDLPQAAYLDLLNTLAQEFTYTFGGCTIIRGLDGSYLSRAGTQIQDRINLISRIHHTLLERILKSSQHTQISLNPLSHMPWKKKQFLLS